MGFVLNVCCTIQIKHRVEMKGNAACHTRYIAAAIAMVVAPIKNIRITSYFFQLQPGPECPIKSK